MQKADVFLPSDEAFTSRDAWQDLGNNLYIAVQAHVVIIQRRGSSVLTSSPRKILSLPIGVEYLNQIKISRIKTYDLEMRESIQSTVTSKFSSDIAAKIASEIGTAALECTPKVRHGK